MSGAAGSGTGATTAPASSARGGAEAARICFFAPYLYPAFRPDAASFAGGAETQQALLARGLAARGWDVHAVVCDYGQPARESRDGVAFHRAYDPRRGLPGVRFLHPRLTGSVRALRQADADVIYVRAAGMLAGIAADVARWTGAAFVFGAAHDDDARRALPLLSDPRARGWYRRALAHASLVIAQTARQQALFRDELGRASEVVPSAVPLPAEVTGADAGRTVLWVGTYKASKRPEWVVELARRMPDAAFVMCGLPPLPPDSSASWDALRAAARELPNLTVEGFAGPAALAVRRAEAAVTVHPSISEGFPNTLLEAWAAARPTVSAYDPDGVIAREGLGAVAGDVDTIAAAVRALLADPARRRAIGERARAYVAARHAPDAVVGRFAGLLEPIARAARARRRG